MQCLFCGKRLSLMKRMGNSRFCSSEHEERFRREQEEAALAVLLDAQASLGQPEPTPPVVLPEEDEPANLPQQTVATPSHADFLIDTTGRRAVSTATATRGGVTPASHQVPTALLRSPQAISGPVLSPAWLRAYSPAKVLPPGIGRATSAPSAPGRVAPLWIAWREAASGALRHVPYEPPSWMLDPAPPRWERLKSPAGWIRPLLPTSFESRLVECAEPFAVGVSLGVLRPVEVIPFFRAAQSGPAVPELAGIVPPAAPPMQDRKCRLAGEHGATLNAQPNSTKPLLEPVRVALELAAARLVGGRAPAPASVPASERGFDDNFRPSSISHSLPVFGRDRFIQFFADLLDEVSCPLAGLIPLPAAPPVSVARGLGILTGVVGESTPEAEPKLPYLPLDARVPELGGLTTPGAISVCERQRPLPAGQTSKAQPLPSESVCSVTFDVLLNSVKTSSAGNLTVGGLTKLAAAAAASGASPVWTASGGLAFGGPSVGRPSARLRVDAESIPPFGRLAPLAEPRSVPPATPSFSVAHAPYAAGPPCSPKLARMLDAGFGRCGLSPVSTRAARSRQEPSVAAVDPPALIQRIPAARIKGLTPGFAHSATLYPVAMPRPAHFKRAATPLALEMAEQRPLRPTACPVLATGEGSFRRWSRRIRVPGSIRLPHSWTSLSRELRWAAMALPLLIGLWFKLAPSSTPQPAPVPVAAQPSQESGQPGFLNAGLQSLRENISRRAAVELVDDFRAGLSSWEGTEGWAKTWNYDAAGFIRPGQLALYEPTRDLVNYHVELIGQIEKRGLSWAVRSADLKNYYAYRLFIARPGPVPGIALTRWAVINGKEDKLVQLPLPHNVRNDTVYQIRVDLHGPDITTYVQGQVADTWSDRRLKAGGVGLFMTRGDQARFRSVAVTHQYDAIGRLCAFLVPPGGIQHNGSLKQ